MADQAEYGLFDGFERLGGGDMAAVIAIAREALARKPDAALLAFDTRTGQQTDLDLRAPPPPPRKAGRPKLGVTPREVTLLPRHWDWLSSQPGGASVTLRRLVEAASRDPVESRRTARDGAYRFLSAIGGDLPGFEEASRTLFRDDREGFLANTETWPGDVRRQALSMLGWD